MKCFLLLSAILLTNIICFAQRNEQVKKLVEEGIVLHDKGDYEGAIKKYDEAIAIDKYDFNANYEKTFSCLSAKKYDDCINLSKWMLLQFADNPQIKNIYVHYGSALDDKGDTQGAIRIFDEGLKKFPDFYLLHFNEGLTQMRLKKYDEALSSYAAALKNNALHPSSNYYTGVILQNSNRIPALLAYLTFIAIEPQSDRSKDAFDRIDEIVYRNIKKDGNKTTISIPMETLDKAKNKNSENDFSSVEFLFTMIGSFDNNKGVDSIAKSAADKFNLKVQLLISSLHEHNKDGKGFYWEHYVPFFVEMKEKKYTAVLSNIIFLSSGDKDSAAWLKENNDKVKEFYGWFDKYEWAPRQ